MLRIVFAVFISLNFYLFASTHDFYLKALNEKEPQNLFNDAIDIVSGNFVIDDEIVAFGKEPIKIKRSYASLNNFDDRSTNDKSHLEFTLAGWSYHDVTKAYFYGDRIDLIEPTGEVFSFDISYGETKKKSLFGKKKKKKKEKKNEHHETHPQVKTTYVNYKTTSYLPRFFNQRDIKIIDPKLIRVVFRSQNELDVIYPNGTQKQYRRENVNANQYNLVRETLLNQNVIHYFYDVFNNLIEIRSTNPTSSKIYAWIKFKYVHPEPIAESSKDKYDLTIETSDGKSYLFAHDNYYPIINNKERSKHPFFTLKNINSNQVTSKFEYLTGYKSTYPLIKEAQINNKKVALDYYLLGNKNMDEKVEFFDAKNSHFQRVKTLKEYGQNTSFANTYKFNYDIENFSQLGGTTTIYDSQNNKYIYSYNRDCKIESVLRFESKNNHHHLLNKEIYSWIKIKDIPHLAYKSFLDEKENVVFTKKYFYDLQGNLIEEKLCGNISKDLTEDSHAQYSETFSHRYKYTNNLLVEISDDSQVAIKYFYLPNTNLRSQKIILLDGKIKKRSFYEYNADFILIKKITDDGIHFEKNDTSQITFRKIKYFYPIANSSFVGLLECCEEKYLDLTEREEKLIKKEKYEYAFNGKISKKEIYDSNNELVYTFFYDYDKKGNIISKKDSLKRERLYSFDVNNNRLSKNLQNGLTYLYEYNACNQLTKKQIKKDGTSYELGYLYDDRNNKIAYLDPRGRTIKYEYDAFSNLIKKLEDNPNFENEKNIETYKYDSLGNITQINQNQNLTKISYNIFSKPTSITYPGDRKQQFIYNLDGSLKTFIDENNVESHYEYDFLKRTTLKKIISNDEIFDEEIYSYNLFGPIEKIDKYGKVKYFYDFAKRLIKEEQFNDNNIFTIEYFYDSLSKRYKTIYNNELVNISKNDLLGRKISQKITDIQDNIFYKKRFLYDDLSLTSFAKENKKLPSKIINPLHDKKLYQKYLLPNPSIYLNIAHLDASLIEIAKKSFFLFDPLNLITNNYLKKIFPSLNDNFMNDEIKNPNISSFTIYLFNDFNLDQVFSKSHPNDKNKIKVVFSKDTLTKMREHHLLIEQILEILKMPTKIDKIMENEFLITHKNVKILVEIINDEEFIIENVLISK